MPVKSRWSISAVLAASLAASLAMPAPAWAAAANARIVGALVAAAQREFDAGNFDRAGELFLEIYRQDATQVAALYNAARAHHLAGKLQKAEDLYTEILATGKLDEATTAKVKGFASEVHSKRGEQKAEEAKKAEGAGQYSAAAECWAEARQLVPGRQEWLLRHARAEQLAGHPDVALSLYEQYLAAAPPEAPGRAVALRWQQELRPPGAALQVGKPATTLPSSAGDKATPVLTYSVAAAGGALLLAGGAVLWLAKTDDGSLQDKQKKVNSAGYIDGVSYQEAATEASRIEGRYSLGWGLVGAGVVGAGVGTWLWLRGSEPRVAVLPGLGGLQLVGRY